MSRDPLDSSAARPAGLTALSVVVMLEALGTGAVAVLSFLASPLGNGVTSGIAVGVFIGVFAVLLVIDAVALLRAQPWSRSATLVWQIVQLLVGLYAIQGAGAALGFAGAAIGAAVVALVLLFSPPVRVALERR